MLKPVRVRAVNTAMQTNSIMLMANVNRSQINITDTHYNIKSIPITVDDAVMNGVLYSATENAKGMQSMMGNPVTLGHPVVDGNGASGRNGAGLDDFFSGGTIKKVYNKSSTWYADVTIKKAMLNAQDGGKVYADMLDNKESIGVSTGLMFEDNQISGTNSKGQDYTKSAINQTYDHLAFLANEEPAGGSDTVMRFNVADIMPNDTKLDRFITAAKAWFVNESESGYNESELITKTNNDGDTIMLQKIKAKLTAANVETNGLDEDALLDAYNAMVKDEVKKKVKAKADGDDEDEDEDKPFKKKSAKNSDDKLALAINALTEKVSGLETQIAVNANAELDGAVAKVVALDKGIDAVAAKAMGLTACNSFLAANSGEVAFNTGSYQPQFQNSADSLMNVAMPEAEK